MIARLLAKLFPEPLPVLKQMPEHVKNLRLDMELLSYQMDSYKAHKSPAVNNAPYLAQKEKSSE